MQEKRRVIGRNEPSFFVIFSLDSPVAHVIQYNQ